MEQTNQETCKMKSMKAKDFDSCTLPQNVESFHFLQISLLLLLIVAYLLLEQFQVNNQV